MAPNLHDQGVFHSSWDLRNVELLEGFYPVDFFETIGAFDDTKS